MSKRGSPEAAAFGRLVARSLFALVAIMGCSAVTGDRHSPGLATSVVISPAGASISGVGSKTVFTAHVIGGNAPIVSWASLNPSVATVDAHSGEVTAATSGQVTISAQADTAIGYAVLTVSVPGVAPVRSWALDTAPKPPSLSIAGGGIWGTSVSNVYVVGAGTPLHYDGAGWRSFIGSVYFLGGIWGSSATDIFAVGGNAHYHFDGASWTNTQDLSGSRVWGSSPRDVYTVGPDGGDRHAIIKHYDGHRWTPQEFVRWGELRDVWGTSATDIFAVGQDGLIVHYDGAQWTEMSSPVRQHLTGVWGTSPSDVYAVGFLGTLVHYNGLGWTQLESGTTRLLWGIWGTSSSDIYVTAESDIRHFDGQQWTATNIPTEHELYGIWGTSVGDVFAVGTDLRVIRGRR